MNPSELYQKLNDTAAEYPSVDLTTLIDQVSSENPDRIAIVCEDETMTYGELTRQSNQFANFLRGQNIGKGQRVGVCCRRDVDMLVRLIGVMKTGAAYVPLDPEYPTARLQHMVQDSEMAHLLTDNDHQSLTDSFDVPSTNIDLKQKEIETFGDTCPADSAPSQADIAYVIYTSGSTGLPKGVLVPHRGAVNIMWDLKKQLNVGPADRMLVAASLAFDFSIAEMFLPLISGGSVVVVERAIAKDSLKLIETCQRHDVTMMCATPALWRMVLEADFAGHPNMVFVTGGEPLPRDLVAPLLERCRSLWNIYGPTETTVCSTFVEIKETAERILIGPPAANTSLFVVDENNELCGLETPGELLIGGDGVTAGYLNRDELNAEKFTTFNGQRVYRTGDLAQVTADGQIDCLGRIDGQIKLNGHRIELEEIDATIGAQAGVRMAATVVREDRPGDKRLVAYLIAEQGQSIDMAHVRESIAKTLPEYMVPALLTTIDEFPMSPNGKLDRKSFPEPASDRPDIGIEFVAPTQADEKQLAEIWSTVLQIDGIGIDDNFFQLGGNSIRAVRAVALIRKQMGIEISNAEFFDNPTPANVLKLAQKKQALKERFAGGQSNGPKKEDSGAYAIVGMSARFPGADNLEQYWNNLVEGRESISFFTPEELDATLDPRDTTDPNYVAARGIVKDADHFDASFFKIMPKAAELIDPQQRLMLEIAWTALEDAGIMPSDQHTIGIWAGTYSTTYYINNVLKYPERVREVGEFLVGAYSNKDFIATRVAHALNLTGPAVNVNTACSTSLVTLIEACKSLALGQCDVAVAGAASVHFPQNSGHLYQTGNIFTPDGHCRPFDADGQGTLFSDGAGAVVVKRLADAVADGDRVYAVVKGLGINNDGGDKASFSAPSIAGQAGAIAMAQADAGISADMIGYVEAHGTATPVGDPIEVSALQTVFDAQTEKRQFCGIGSVKSNIGHTVAAAGVAGLIKATLALHHEEVPATLHYQKANPQIDFANSPFYVCDELTPWARTEQPRYAAVSAFGVGGTNAHVVLQESPALASIETNDGRLPVSVLPVSGKSEAAMLANVKNLADHIGTYKEELSLEDVAHTLQAGREHFTWRSAVVCQTIDDAAEVLSTAKAPRFIKRKSSATPRDIVFMFPGQGSQYVRMGQNLYQHSSVFKDNLDRCAELLSPLLGRDLRDVLFPADGGEEASSEILRNTQFTQPALFAIGYSLAQVWLAWGIKPTALMGHSIGEFSAACVAGVFTLEDGLKIIAERGRAMQALPGGSMMSVRLPGATVQPMLWGDMAIGSYNGPELCVVAGPDKQVADLQKQLEAEGVVCRHLYTSHAFHSPMMNGIVEPFTDFVSQFQLSVPATPILSTVTGDWMTDAQATDPAYWADHLRQPVQFSGAVSRMWDEDATRILIELGPRSTLSTLAKQHATDPKKQTALPTLGSTIEDNAEWTSMLSAVAQLWLTGVSVDWSRLTGDGQPVVNRKVSLPTYAFQRKRYFLEPPLPDPPSTDPPLSDPPKGQQISTEQTEHSSPTSQTQPTTQKEIATMSRIPNIIAAIETVFEDTSGFELNEFDGDTTFFEMGLDSLVLTQTATALKKEMGIDITFRQMLEQTPTVDSLAEWFDGNLPADKYAATAAPVAEAPAPAAVAVAAPAVEAAPAPANVAAPANVVSQPAAPVAMAAAPVAAPVQMAAPTIGAMPVAAQGDATQMLLNSQLQLMQAQLQLLGGQPVAAAQVQPVTQVAAPAQPQVEAQVVQSPAPAAQAPAVAAAEVAAVASAGSQRRCWTEKQAICYSQAERRHAR